MPEIDLAVFRALQETAGAEFVSELVDTFLQDAPATLRELRSAWDDRSAERFRRAAHSLKSNGDTFGAQAFAALARDLELRGLPPDAAPIATLEESFAAVAAALRELCRG
jgi:HPt (histidine-containing phosphotransfer) domain-containing protein